MRLIAPLSGTVIRYTLDGSEPEPASRRYAGLIRLTATTTIKAAAFWPDGGRSGTASFLYRKASGYQAAVDARALAPGLAWRYLEDGRVERSGVIERFTFDPASPYVPHPKAKSSLVWTGYLRVPRKGVYTFQRPATNMALSIGGTVLFTTRGGLGDREETAQTPLDAGYHRVEAVWMQSREGYYSLDCPVHREGPGIPMQPVPAAALFREQKASKSIQK